MTSKLQTLPVEILQYILLEIPKRIDYVALRSTCQKCYNATLDDSFKARRLPIDIADVIRQHRESTLQHYPRMLENTRARGWDWEQQRVALYGRNGWRLRLVSPSAHLDANDPSASEFLDGTRPPVDSQRRKNHLLGLRKWMAKSQRLAARQVVALPADYEELLSQTNGLECCATNDRDSDACSLLVSGVGRKSLYADFFVTRNQVMTAGPLVDFHSNTSIWVTIPFPVKYAFQLGGGWYLYFLIRPVWVTVYAYCQVDEGAEFAWKIIHVMNHSDEHKNAPNLVSVFDNLVDFLSAMLRQNLVSPQEWDEDHVEQIPYTFFWNGKLYRPPGST